MTGRSHGRIFGRARAGSRNNRTGDGTEKERTMFEKYSGVFLLGISIPFAFGQQPTQLPADYARAMTEAQKAHPTLAVGEAAPDFSLRGIDDKIHTLAEYQKYPVLGIVFISNHCPASQMYEGRMKRLVERYGPKGFHLIAIAPNGPAAVTPRELNYSDVDDSFESMITRAEFGKFNFPYLYDGDTQEVSLRYGPKVTPHIFLFDSQRKLRFEGRIDDSLRESLAKTHEAADAIEALLEEKPVAVDHTAVFGCSVKWNTQAVSKQREMKEWLALPVSVEVATAEVLKQLRNNPTGKTLMINFWATWCGPCVTEMRDLLTTYLWYRSRDFELVTVSTNGPGEKAAVLKFLHEQHSAVRNLQYATDDVYAMQAAFDPKWESGVPFTIVLAPDGREIYREEGEVDLMALRRAILANLPDAGMFAGNVEYWRGT